MAQADRTLAAIEEDYWGVRITSSLSSVMS
jgi:hypothetical protein